MKKLLLLILVLVLAVSVFVGCQDETCTNHVDANNDGKCDNCGTETAPAVDEGLQSALDFIHQDHVGLAKETPASYTVLTKVIIGSETYIATWTVSSSAITITPSDDGTKATVNIPDAEEAIPYTLTVVVKSSSGEEITKTYEHTVPKFAYSSFDDYANAEEDTPLAITGIVSGIVSKSTGSNANAIYVQDLNNEGGYYVYSFSDKDYDPASDLKVGMTVEVKGTKTTYNGTYELKNAEVTILDSSIKVLTPVDYTDIILGTDDLTDAALTGKQGMLVTIRGVEIADYVSANSYYRFKIGDHTTYIRISGSANPTDSESLETIKAIHAANFGNKADVTGIIALYNKAFYLIPVGADAFSNIQVVERTDADKAQAELDTITGIPSQVLVNSEIKLPTAGSMFTNVTLAWTSNNAAIAIGNGKATITMPGATTDVKLTVSATCGETTLTREFTVSLVKPIPTTVKEATTIALGKEHNTYTTELYLLEVTIKEITKEEYGNMTVVDADGNEFTIYGTYDATGAKKFGELSSKPVAGDKIILAGVLGQYNETAQMKNAWMLGFESSSNPNPTPTPSFSPVQPVVGTAYKLGMIHGQMDNKIYYIAGGMNGYYMATTESFADALDVYVEETTGGYYIYVMNGSSKEYINAVVDGTYVNAKFETTGTTVYTWNDTLKALTTLVDGKEYVHGTRNDKTYTTAGPCLVEKEPFYLQFTLAGSEDTPVVPSTPTEDKKYTFADYEAGAQYAENESHVLDDIITVTTNDAHFTTQIRLYDSVGSAEYAGHDGIAIIKSTKTIKALVLNAGYKAATLNVYGSNDGSTWTLLAALTTKTSYADYTVDASAGYTFIKLDAVDAQVRVAAMTLSFAGSSSGSDEVVIPEEKTEIYDFLVNAYVLKPGANSDAVFMVEGKIIAIRNASKGNIVIVDKAGNELYVSGISNLADFEIAARRGDTVVLVGHAAHSYNEKTGAHAYHMDDAIVYGVVAGTPIDAPADVDNATIPEILEAGSVLVNNNDQTENMYTVSGTIVEIANSKYGNLYIQDEAGNKLYVYGCTSELGNALSVNDKITIRGVISFYNGVQLKNAEVLAHEVAFVKPTTPEAIVDALFALGKGETLNGGSYTLTGVITECGTYNTTYNNITVTIVVNGMTDKAIECYRLSGTGADTLKVGDTITVTGTLKDYNGKKEFDKPTLDSVVPATPETPDTPDTPAANVTVSKTTAELATAAGNWSSSANVAKNAVALDDVASFTVAGGSNSGKYYDDGIRIYATDTPAGSITISVKEGYELVSVKITTKTGTYAYLQIAGNDATDLSNTTVEVSGSSVTLNSVKNGSNGKQVRVSAIEVVYKAV